MIITKVAFLSTRNANDKEIWFRFSFSTSAKCCCRTCATLLSSFEQQINGCRAQIYAIFIAINLQTSPLCVLEKCQGKNSAEVSIYSLLVAFRWSNFHTGLDIHFALKRSSAIAEQTNKLSSKHIYKASKEESKCVLRNKCYGSQNFHYIKKVSLIPRSHSNTYKFIKHIIVLVNSKTVHTLTCSFHSL